MILLLVLGCVPELPELDDPCAAWEEPGLYRHVVSPKDGPKRRSFVWVPTAEGPRDVVVAVHGGASTAREFSDVSQYIKFAENEGFVAVFPQGRGDFVNAWNAGACCGSPKEDRRDIDDVAFLEQLVAEVRPLVCGDRVLGTGFSNGAMLVHRWGCEGTAMDAIVPASGPLELPATKCTGRPLPVRHYHGTKDDLVPYEGGPGDGFSDLDRTSVDETMAVWRDRNGCADTDPQVTTTGDTTCEAWSCQVPTELCTVEGWGHAWPGGRNADRTDADATRDGYAWFTDLWGSGPM